MKNFRLENIFASLLPYGRRKERVVNALLAASAAFFAVWSLLIWVSPVETPADAGHILRVKDRVGSSYMRVLPASSYMVIVEKDVFRPARQMYVPPKPKPKVAPPPPPPPPRRPPPRLTLIGTVLLDDGEAAIMDNAGTSQKGGFYKVGDVIEEFVIKNIRKDFVILKRDGETLKVVMSISAQQPNKVENNEAPPIDANEPRTSAAQGTRAGIKAPPQRIQGK